ncbi:MAG: class I SAM-dependent methyltransferase, partial [Pseudomonadota bacterium]
MAGSAYLNLYGDKLPAYTGRRGANISSQRVDDLDRLCNMHSARLHIKGRKKLRTVDLGCGDGIQGLRFSLYGYESYLYDKEALPREILALRSVYPLVKFKFRKCDLSDVSNVKLPPNGVDICYSQRSIHYLDFFTARNLLSKVCDRMSSAGLLFISASGLSSEIGHAHPDKLKSVEQRYSKLPIKMANNHSIHDEICVYSSDDLEKLGRQAGFLP